MWFFLTPLLLIALIVALYWIGEVFFDEGAGAAIFGGIVGTTVAIFLMFGLFPHLAGAEGDVREVSSEDRDLQALGTDTAVQGQTYRGVFLGRGWVNEKQMITYVYENADGGFVLDRSNASQSVIYEDEQDDPYVTISKYELVPNGWIAPYVSGWTTTDQYEFHIPEGSVADDFAVTP